MTTPEMPDAQECKRRAFASMEKLGAVGRDANALSLVLQTAQVWATLATVPEPLDEEITDLDPVVGQLLLQQPELPNLICPHGFAARLSRNIAAQGERPRLKYSWTNCTQGCP